MPRPAIRRPGRGFASLEFVMSLPLLLILFSAILSGGSAAMNRLQVSIGVRRDAWARSHGTPPARRLDLPIRSPMGALAGVATDAGLVTVERSRSVQLARTLSLGSHTATYHHSVLAGSWDHQSIPFAANPPMQADPRFVVFAGGAVAFPF